MDLYLVHQQDRKRQTLARMRRKLAGATPGVAPVASRTKPAVRRGDARRQGWLRWGTLLGAAALLAVGNFGLRGPREEATAKARTPRAPVVNQAPASLSVDEQALFWTYALYDFGKLRKTYGIPAGAAVNNAAAHENLRALLPKVGARTRFTIEGYLPKTRSKP